MSSPTNTHANTHTATPTSSSDRPSAGASGGGVTVRRATPDDANTLQVMLLELADHEGDGQHVHVDVDQWCRMLAEPRVVVLLAEDETGQLGYVSAVHQPNLWMGRDIVALDDLYVRSGARNRGVGEQLMTALAQHAAAEQQLIRWEMRADNDGAQRFYRRLDAKLRTKVIATWSPHDYTARL
jgi:ribosomal protein S18 acetylase RimI-like enzyme